MLIRQEKPRVAIKNWTQPLDFRLITIEDEAWIRDRMPNGLMDLIESMKKNEHDLLLDTVWHFLDIHTKEALIKQKVIVFRGAEKIEIEETDYRGKLRNLIGGQGEISSCLEALFKCWRLSMPDEPRASAEEKKS